MTFLEYSTFKILPPLPKITFLTSAILLPKAHWSAGRNNLIHYVRVCVVFIVSLSYWNFFKTNRIIVCGEYAFQNGLFLRKWGGWKDGPEAVHETVTSRCP